MTALDERRGSRATRVLRRVVASALLGVALSTFAATTERETLEYQVKASYLFNFLQFIKWPDGSFREEDGFNFCVVEAERFGQALGAIARERVRGRAIIVHRLEAARQALQSKCHLLFIANAPGAPAADVRLQRGLLTIGEAPGFLNRGGIINLIKVDGRVRFEINQDAAREVGLVISSRLLALAVN